MKSRHPKRADPPPALLLFKISHGGSCHKTVPAPYRRVKFIHALLCRGSDETSRKLEISPVFSSLCLSNLLLFCPCQVRAGCYVAEARGERTQVLHNLLCVAVPALPGLWAPTGDSYRFWREKKKKPTKTTQDSHAYLAYLQTPPSTWLLCPADRPLLPWAELGATCSTGVDSSLEQQAVKAERVCI